MKLRKFRVPIDEQNCDGLQPKKERARCNTRLCNAGANKVVVVVVVVVHGESARF